MTLVWASVQAETPDTRRWFDPCLTHSGPAELDEVVGQVLTDLSTVSGLSDCGDGDNITIRWNESIGYAGIAYASWWPDWFGKHCPIEIHPSVTDLYRVVMHEVGHCIGFQHRPDGTVITDDLSEDMSPSVRAMLEARYPSNPEPGPILAGSGLVTWEHPDTALRTAGPEQYQAVYYYGPLPHLGLDIDGNAVHTGWLRWARGAPTYTQTLWTLREGSSYWLIP
jgi:hypothetical protein